LTHRDGLYCFFTFLIFLTCGCGNPIPAAECRNITFEYQPSDFYGPGDYFLICPAEQVRIRCYHYHRHWVCEKDELLYWDRRLESAARTACGCPLPPDTVPAAPATSVHPGEDIFGSEE
jgi:hypothetical protein